uniref:Uncharacterized protein n=1 Tax=Phenylobacterium glaciei TaxID=2803784 RepID=A0A974P6E0_9CAUL|nr:hypothetical protein JKL49_08875 [Phenylobacterium glaciei]
MTFEDEALVALLAALKARDYRFITPQTTPTAWCRGGCSRARATPCATSSAGAGHSATVTLNPKSWP